MNPELAEVIKEEVERLSDEALIKLYFASQGEMYDRKITEEAAEIMADDEELLRLCEVVWEDGDTVEYQGFLISSHEAKNGPDYYQVRTVDTGIHVGMISESAVSNHIQLATQVLDRMQNQLELEDS